MGLLDIFRGKPSINGVIIENGKAQEIDLGEISSDNNSTNNVEGTNSFKLVVDDVFCITGRGTVVTGKVLSGELYVGNKVNIKNRQTGNVKTVTVTGIEMFRKVLDYAKTGDNVGILLSETSKSDINPGDEIYN